MNSDFLLGGYYQRRDLHLATRQQIVERLKARPPAQIAGRKVRQVETLDGIKLRFDDGWLLFRASGTEPLLRLYCEMHDWAALDQVLGQAEKLVRDVG